VTLMGVQSRISNLQGAVLLKLRKESKINSAPIGNPKLEIGNPRSNIVENVVSSLDQRHFLPSNGSLRTIIVQDFHSALRSIRVRKRDSDGVASSVSICSLIGSHLTLLHVNA
jgi:hypothetical protein